MASKQEDGTYTLHFPAAAAGTTATRLAGRGGRGGPPPPAAVASPERRPGRAQLTPGNGVGGGGVSGGAPLGPGGGALPHAAAAAGPGGGVGGWRGPGIPNGGGGHPGEFDQSYSPEVQVGPCASMLRRTPQGGQAGPPRARTDQRGRGQKGSLEVYLRSSEREQRGPHCEEGCRGRVGRRAPAPG